MYTLRRRGFGQAISVQALPGQGGGVVGNIATCSSSYWSYFTNAPCWSRAFSDWQGMAMQAAPPTPPVPLLTQPPASGEQAAQTVTDIANAVGTQQQAIDAAQVQPDTSLLGILSGATPDPNSLLNPTNWNWTGIAIVAGIAVLGLAAIGGGGPRRYGR